jgi:hypothetical protein
MKGRVRAKPGSIALGDRDSPPGFLREDSNKDQITASLV